MGKGREADPYRFEPSLERALTALCCCRPRFWGRLGQSLDPDATEAEQARLVLSACRQIASETGNGPTSRAQVVQRLRAWVIDGRVTTEAVNAASRYVFDGEDDLDAGTWTEESAVAEAVRIVRPRLEQQALMRGSSEWSARGDLAPVAEELLRAGRLGEASASAGEVFSADSILPRVSGDCLETGIRVLDDALGGGTTRGELCVAVAEHGAGKSMYLTQVAAEAALCQKFVAYATLEVSARVTSRRLGANLATIPLDAIKNGASLELARERVRATPMGPIVIQEFAANATSVGDIAEWIRAAEVNQKRAVDVLVVDYADLLMAPKERDEYKAMKVVFTDLRNLLRERDLWGWTATQARRKKEKQKRVDGDDVSDSINKTRVADTMITFNYHEEEKEIDIYLAKGRDLEARRMVVTGLPTDFANGLFVVGILRGAARVGKEASFP